MPDRYHCTECELTFEVGWFHYHIPRAGFGSMTLLVCNSCGAQHGVEQSVGDVGPEWLSLYDFSLLAVPQPVPISVLRLVRRDLKLTLAEAKDCVHHLPLCIAKEVPEEWGRR